MALEFYEVYMKECLRNKSCGAVAFISVDF